MEKNLKTLKKFINENSMVSHKDGTYMSVTLDKPSQDKLFSWVEDNDIVNACDPSQYHSTVIYSRKSCPDAVEYDLGLPIESTIKEFKLFDTQTGKKCLVGIIDSKELDKHHDILVDDYGATHDFPEYHPHVTISYDFIGNIPKEVPDFVLTFDSSECKALDPNFVPDKAKK
jgi:hypothetical protein